MPSAPRGFVANEPVLVTTRCVMRVRLYQCPEVKAEIRRQFACWAPRCGVEVLAWTIVDNHIHALLSQPFSGHDKRRKKGIAAFMRDALSQIAFYTNGFVGSMGHCVERTYLSRGRGSAEEALQSVAYILEHPIKHGVEGGIDAENSAGRLYVRSRADGIATAILGIFLLRDPEARGAAIHALLDSMWNDPRWSDAKQRVEVARSAIRDHPDVVDRNRWRTTISVAVWAGAEEARRAREAVLTAPRARSAFEPRTAPSVGDVVTIVVRRMESRPWTPRSPVEDSS